VLRVNLDPYADVGHGLLLLHESLQPRHVGHTVGTVAGAE
jgi:hypothetical protein